MTLSIVIPAYNEEEGIVATLKDLRAFFETNHIDGKILVIDDGSTDATAQKAQEVDGVQVIKHHENRGYGASLKTGISNADTEWCITFDADGQHTSDQLPKLIAQMQDNVDMVVGKREGYKGPALRQPGKWLIGKVANFLVERKIPDINSGLRAFRRETFLQYAHLFPNGFSLSTTSTVCYFKENRSVVYVPITIQPRVGKSTVKPSDAIKTLMFILRLIMMFSPLRIFLPVSILLGVGTTGLLIQQIVMDRNITDAAIVMVALTTSLFFFGLLADQLAAVRREINRK